MRASSPRLLRLCLLALIVFCGLADFARAAGPLVAAPVISPHNPTPLFRIADPITLSARIWGPGPLTVTWQRDGVIQHEYLIRNPVVGSDFPIDFKIDSAKATDAGNYIVTVSNPHGTVSSEPWIVTIEPPPVPLPEFMESPSPRTVALGMDFMMSAWALSATPVQYQWLKDGVPLPGFTSERVFFYPATQNHVGWYSLRATNAQGSTESTAARVEILPATPLHILSQPSHLTLLRSGLLDLTVEARSSEWMTYQWYKDDVALPGKTHFSFFKTGSQASDAGTYKVVITTASQQLTSDPIVVSYHPSAQLTPTIVSQPSRMTVSVGENTALQPYLSDYSGDDLSYQWRRGGVDIPGATRAFLFFQNAQVADSGTYSVSISNDAGATVSKDMHFTVTAGDIIIYYHPTDLHFSSNGHDHLVVNINHNLASVIGWERDGQAIPNSNSVYFVLDPGTPGSFEPGSYRAVIGTNAGATLYSDPAIVTMDPVAPPVILSHPVGLKTYLGEYTNLTVRAQSMADMAYQWYKNGALLAGATDYHLYLDTLAAEETGTYHAEVTNSAGTTVSDDAVISLLPSGPPVILTHPTPTIVPYGADIFLNGGVLRIETGTTYQWFKDGVAIGGGDTGSLLLNVTPATVGRYHFIVTTPNGAATSAVAPVSILAGTGSPAFLLQPAGQHAAVNSSISFSAFAKGHTTPTYQWRRDGVDIAGATSSTFGLPSVNASSAGTYTVVATNTIGSTESTPATLTVNPVGRLLNLSARALSRGGDDVLIAGFVVQGTAPKRLLIRGVGPTLTEFGVQEPLTNPKLTIFDSNRRARYTVEDWDDSAADPDAQSVATARVGAFGLPTGSNDAGIIVKLDPGNYTAHITNPALDTPRVGLVELYDLDTGTPRLINISTLAYVRPGEGALTAGFYVEQGAPKRLLIRAVGPGLMSFNVPNRLIDPKLEIHRMSDRAMIAENDSWSATDAATMEASFDQVAAFDLTHGSTDAALIITLPTGGYTATITGADGGSGNALVEVYELSAP